MWRKRKLWVTLLAAPLLLVGVDTIYWQIAESSLQSNFALWLASQRVAGWTASTGDLTRGGWPFAATLTVPTVRLKVGASNRQNAVSWSADRLILRVGLFRPMVLGITPEGEQHLSLAGGPDLAFTAGRARVTMPVQAAGALPSWLQLTASNLRVTSANATDPATAWSVERLDAHFDLAPAAQASAPAIAVSLSADEIDPPGAIAHLLGPRIASFALEGALDGPLPDSGPLGDRAAAWRDGGGSLEVRRLALTWGPLALTGSVTLALDDELQPMGAGTAHIIGYAETLDALAAHGMLSRSASTAAKAVLSLLAHAPDDGSPPDVDVPLTLQYRTLAMRQVPLFRLPELTWH
jgi:hypothetical protein